MKMARFNREEAQSIFSNLRQAYTIITPVERPGKGKFSDTNLLAYDEVNSFDEIEFFKKTSFSAKSVLFPIRETMFTFQDNKPEGGGLPSNRQGHKIEEVNEGINPAIIFLRSCDIHAIRVLDAYFLGSAGYEDFYYKRRRQKLSIFLIECKEPFKNCFCASFGTNRTEDYSAFMRKTNEGYEVQIKDEELKEYFPAAKMAIRDPQFVEQDACPVKIPKNIDVSIFDDETWEEYTFRCIACGRYTINCPTCACFSVHDVLAEDKTSGKRERLWSSCQVKKFSLLAGSHDFRIKEGDRVRYRLLHKMDDFRKRHGFNMCVGCGRCDDVCPEYISMFKCIEKINDIIEAGSTNG